MALTTCKECKREVSEFAKVCPGCGVKKPGFRWWRALAGLAILFLIATLIANWTSTEEFVVQGGTAKEYKIVGTSDYSTGGRDRLRIHIVSEKATTMADRAATAQAAAKAYLNDKQVQQVTAHLEVGDFAIYKGNQLAIATYTPDGCGNSGRDCDGKAWEIFTSDRQLTPSEMAIMEEWYTSRDSFRKKDGLVDEGKLKRFISKKLQIPLEQVTLPYIDRQEITKGA